LTSSFDFLKIEWPILLNIAEFAEKSLYIDSNTSLIKLRQFAEFIGKLIIKYENLTEPDSNNQQDRIKLLEKEDLLETEIRQIFHSIRIMGNKAVHEGHSSTEDAKIYLRMAFKLGAWFKEVYGNEVDFDSSKQIYIELENIDFKVELEKLKNENEALQKKFVEFEKSKINYNSNDNKKEKASKASRKIVFDEAETRKIIDEQLRAAGWEADTENIRYGKGVRPKKSKSLAIAEWPTKGKFVDYALFVDLEFIGVIEAKKKSRDILSVLDESKMYSKKSEILGDEYFPEGSPFGKYKVPFMFSMNGRQYIKQLEEKSGVWFLDGRKATNHPRVLHNILSPRDLKELIKIDKDGSNDSLKKEPYDYLTASDGLGLRDYQIFVIKAVEKAIIEGKDKVLVNMATGTGKTRTAIGLIYRLIKAKRFNRILFVVDRGSLGIQAADSFKEAKMEDLQTFSKIFDVKELKDKEPEDTTKVHIATIQGLVRRILYASEDEFIPSVRQYDCIIVDEAHRGYILDRELSEDEVSYKNQDDYISKYKKALEYFDAVKIGLTATPALHTIDIFNEPVARYGYRQAVIDGYLVDHEPPYIIQTELNTGGIKWEMGEEVAVFNRHEEKIEAEILEDELKIDIEGFNKRVITKNFNKTVVSYLVNVLDPESEGKTLIFAATDEHADMLVQMLKEEFENAGWDIDDNAIKKITGYIKDQEEAIKMFKNEKYPNIVVTVDLLTTGIDVPEITNLVFVRRVKSRILYEQMIGRATRLCNKIGKDHFKIYDAVGLYDSLTDYSDMKPIVKDPKKTFEKLFEEMKNIQNDRYLQTEERMRNQIDEIVAKFQRKKKTIEKLEAEEFFKIKTKGQSPEEYIEEIKKLPLKDATEKLLKDAEIFEYLDKLKYYEEKQYISEHEDTIIGVKRGYGKDNKKPGDYIEEFRKFVNENRENIEAMKVLCQSPDKLSRNHLKELKMILDENGYNEISLNSAFKDLDNSEIMADIISYIRNAVLDEPLISHEARINNAVNKIRNYKKWNTLQLKWIETIEKQLLNENVISKEDFEKGAFKSKGGFKQINEKVFAGELETILNMLNDSLYNISA
jgi:type I restriction enzyme R subunit